MDERETVVEKADFTDATDLATLLTSFVWSECPPKTVYVVVDHRTLSRAELVERRLSDGSLVYDARLS